MHTSKYVVYVHDQSRLHVVENTRRTDERSKNGYPPGTKVRIRQHALDIHQMHTISDVGFLSCEMHRSFRDYSCVLASPTTLDRAGTPRPVEIRKLYKRWQDLLDEKQFRMQTVTRTFNARFAELSGVQFSGNVEILGEQHRQLEVQHPYA